MQRVTSMFTIFWLVACGSAGPEALPDAGGAAPSDALPKPVGDARPARTEAASTVTSAERVGGEADALEPQRWPLRERLSRSAQGLGLETRPDGVKRMPLQGRFSSAVLIHRNAAGQRERVCVDSADAAERVLGAAQ